MSALRTYEGKSARARQIVRALGGQWFDTYGTACCPAHQDRKPSLSVREKNGSVLLHCFAGCPPAKIRKALRSHARSLPLEDTKLSRHSEADDPNTDKAGHIQSALRIWRATEKADGTVVERYLRSNRGIEAPIPEVLRFHPALKHRPSATVYPGMIALVTNGVTGEAVGVHRTYLSPDGTGKAPVVPNKMMLGPTGGGAVRLLNGSGPLLIGEGVETCLSVMQATGHATWAALSTSGVRTLDLPEAIHDVILIPDSDDQGQGVAAAQHAARRWCRQGRIVRIAPAPPGSDFNDLLTKKRERPTW